MTDELTPAKIRLRWKKNPAETGLRAMGAGPRGSKLHDGIREYASVNPLGGNWARKLQGWYWVAGWGSGIPHRNTCGEPEKDEDTAKAQAMKYVKAALEKRDARATRQPPDPA